MKKNKRWHLIEAILNLLKKSKLQVGNLTEKQVNCNRTWTTKLSPFWDTYFAQQKRKERLKNELYKATKRKKNFQKEHDRRKNKFGQKF